MTSDSDDERDYKRVKLTEDDDNEIIELEDGYPELMYSDPILLPQNTNVTLSTEQKDVLKCALEGHNIFYTGSAGCGKSLLLKELVKRLRDMGKMVRITAPTGRAALEIQGTTTWSFAGWQPDSMKLSIKELEKRATGRIVKERLRATDVLFIDEISMVENHFLERLDRIMKTARDSEDSFGGVQVVVTGDFFQLPPVRPFEYCMECGKATEEQLVQTQRACPDHGIFYDCDKWAFLAHAWEDANFKCFNLREVHRQTEPELIAILEKIRLGDALKQQEMDRLMNHQCVDMKSAVQLFSTKEQVRRVNVAEFAKLGHRKHVYWALDFDKVQPRHKQLKEKRRRSVADNSLLALNNHTYESVLELKKGMLVILLSNLDIAGGLVNGSQGRVVGFRPYCSSDLEKPKNKYTESSPNVDDREERNASQYATSLGGSYHILQLEQMREFIMQDRNKDKLWPVVEFNNGKRITIVADCRVSELGDDKPFSLIARTQIPLCPAWAITIHKSQGMTLDKVRVDLSRSFEQGQEYVALSRCRTLEGMKVTGLRNDFTGGNANPEVLEFMQEQFGSLRGFQRPMGLEIFREH